MRLIDADALQAELLRMGFFPAMVKAAIRRTPTVDAVEVVRCRDCKHWHEETGWCDQHSHFVKSDGEACHPWERSEWKRMDEDDSCSYGERRADGDS